MHDRRRAHFIWTMRLLSPTVRARRAAIVEEFPPCVLCSEQPSSPRWRASPRQPRPGHQGRRRHLRLDRLCAADAGQGGRHLQEERPRRRRSRRSRRRTATWPSPRATSSARRPRSRPGSSGTPTAWPPSRSSSSTRATAPTAWWCATTSQSIKDLKGKTVAASAPGTAPYFTLAWMLKKNGLTREGRDRRQPGAGRRRRRRSSPARTMRP